MRRRLTLAILGTVAAALLLTGLGTLVLTRLQVRRTAKVELSNEAEALVSVLVQDVRPRTLPTANRAAAQQRRLNAAKQALKLADATVVVFDAQGNEVDGSIPSNVSVSSSDLAALQAGQTVSGESARMVWAAAASPADSQGRHLVIVLTRSIPFGLGSVQWLLLSAGVVLLLAVGVSMRLSRRLIAPLQAADVATRRLADGDLSARVPEPPAAADDELSDLSRAINSMAGALERSRGLEQQFLLSVSHDLRTPLTSIRGYAEAITDGATDDPQAAARVILAESRRLERLVRDLLDLAKLDARSFSLDLEPVDLVEVVTSTADGLRPAAEAAGVALVAPPPGGSGAPPVVLADRDRLAQVAANLLENALKFARTRIDILAAVDGGVAMMWVTDDGPGIAPADLPHVFERLYVAQAQPLRKESGTGLGLAIARELVTAMNGTIGVESAPGAGTRFVVRLPLAGGAVAEPVVPVPPVPAPPPAVPPQVPAPPPPPA
ncbi:MAG TPA: HAMP domain-containing sensor histidine kinase [Acidimicrobiales bacterium]